MKSHNNLHPQVCALENVMAAALNLPDVANSCIRFDPTKLAFNKPPQAVDSVLNDEFEELSH